jgi:hypothetical protein
MIPPGFARRRANLLFLQPSTDFLDGQPIIANPLKDLTYDASLLQSDLILCLAAHPLAPDIVIPVGGTTENIDRPSTGGMQFAPTTAFHDLRSFVLRHHPLNL